MEYYTQLLEKLSNQWGTEISLHRNEFLVMSGEVNTHLCLLEEGSLRVFVESETEEHTIRFGYKNSIITALVFFKKEKPIIFYMQVLRMISK